MSGKMEIKVGQKFKCRNRYREGVATLFTEGEEYTCHSKNTLTNNSGCVISFASMSSVEFFTYFESSGTKTEEDNVNHPKHYTSHPSGVECITITRHYPFSIGNAIKYLWRAGLKKDASLEDKQKEIEDLKKSIWYINDRINQLENDKT